MITKEEKAEILKQFGRKAGDTGSTEVQVAILTKRINNLTPHFTKHDSDYSSSRGLMRLIGQRRSLLKYLAKTDEGRYNKLIKTLDLRK